MTQSTLTTLTRLPNFPRLSLAVLLVGLSTSVAGPYIPLFASTQAHMSPLALGIFMTLLAMSGIVISVLLARWSDALPSRRPVVLLAVGAAAIGFLLLCLTRAYLPLLLIVCLFLGTGAASFPQLFALAKSQLQGADPQVSEHGITTLRSVFSLAWVVGPGLGALLVGEHSFNTLFATAAALYLGAGLTVWFARPPPAESVGTTPRRIEASGPKIPMWKLVTSFVLYGTSMSMGALALPLYLIHGLHGTTSQVGLLLGLCAALEIPVMLSFVVLPRRWGTHSLIVFAFGLMALYFAALYLAGSFALLAWAQVLRAIVIAVAASQGMLYFQQRLPGRIGAATTLFANTTSIGSMLAGVVSGGVAQVFGYRAVFVVCAVCTLLAWLLLYSAGRQAKP
ncbi:sugar efflux transporter [Deinococcus sp.]|uniref:sugar efflux transporter n=1 Tax=Deinococcus sp. TaxID=47478 RepID=UPI003CC66E01